jgi:hypothetical protein
MSGEIILSFGLALYIVIEAMLTWLGFQASQVDDCSEISEVLVLPLFCLNYMGICFTLPTYCTLTICCWCVQKPVIIWTDVPQASFNWLKANCPTLGEGLAPFRDLDGVLQPDHGQRADIHHRFKLLERQLDPQHPLACAPVFH